MLYFIGGIILIWFVYFGPMDRLLCSECREEKRK